MLFYLLQSFVKHRLFTWEFHCWAGRTEILPTREREREREKKEATTIASFIILHVARYLYYRLIHDVQRKKQNTSMTMDVKVQKTGEITVKWFAR